MAMCIIYLLPYFILHSTRLYLVKILLDMEIVKNMYTADSVTCHNK
jgi:hypothetical protein